jgi:hypothetical protein
VVFQFRLTSKRVALLAVGGLALAGGAVYAAIPDSNGVIHGCIDERTAVRGTKALRVFDTADTAACPSGMTPIEWNQTGPPGPQGEQGLQGAQGDQGPAGSAAGYAAIDAAGNVNEAKAFNITDANVTHPQTGVYCIGGLPFQPKVAVGNGQAGLMSSPDPAVVVIPSSERTLVQVQTLDPSGGTFLGVCETATDPHTAQVRIYVHSFSANALADRPFTILLDD